MNQKLGRISCIIKKPIPVTKDHCEELQELGRKLDVEISEFDTEYICPNVTTFNNEYDVHEILGEGCLGLVKRIVHKET